jgi:hypothetical protein
MKSSKSGGLRPNAGRKPSGHGRLQVYVSPSAIKQLDTCRGEQDRGAYLGDLISKGQGQEFVASGRKRFPGNERLVVYLANDLLEHLEVMRGCATKAEAIEQLILGGG